MPRSFGILLTLALMLPAALLPQGVRLVWCWCPGVGSACCGVDEVASCCSGDEHGHEDAAEESSREDGLQRRPDCDACHELHVDPNPGPVLDPEPAPVHVLLLWERVDACSPRPAFVERVVARAPRAPPGDARPLAQRPGSAPLRL